MPMLSRREQLRKSLELPNLPRVMSKDSHWEPRMPAVDPFAWAEDFQKWALAQCVYRDRSFGGIRGLNCDFRDWLIAHDKVPCTLDTFERLLNGIGFLIADGFVSGLVLRRTLALVSRKPTDRVLRSDSERGIGGASRGGPKRK